MQTELAAVQCHCVRFALLFPEMQMLGYIMLNQNSGSVIPCNREWVPIGFGFPFTEKQSQNYGIKTTSSIIKILKGMNPSAVHFSYKAHGTLQNEDCKLCALTFIIKAVKNDKINKRFPTAI